MVDSEEALGGEAGSLTLCPTLHLPLAMPRLGERFVSTPASITSLEAPRGQGPVEEHLGP